MTQPCRLAAVAAPGSSALAEPMNTWWLRVRWQAAVVAGVLLVLFAAVTHEAVWGWLGLEHYPPYYFIDTMAVLAAGQAWHLGLHIYRPNPFDPFGRPHVYGPWWLLSGWLGLTVADSGWLGPLLGLAFILTAVAILAPRRAGPAGVALLLLASPPVLLALERGNNDLVVFLLFAAAGALLARTALPAAGGAAFIGLAAALKMYPLAALPALAARAAPRRSVWTWIGLTAGGCLLVFLLWRNDFTQALTITPRPATIYSYGVNVLFWMWEWTNHPGPLGLQATIFGLGVLGAAVVLGRRFRALLRLVPPTGPVTAWFVAGAASWCVCYLTTSNYPYRAVLLLLPARLWLDRAMGPRGPEVWIGRAMLAACGVMFWLQPLKSWCGLAINQSATADVGMALVLGLEQALVVTVTAALLLSSIGWVWRRLRMD